MRHEDNRTSFWDTLRVFWSAERVNAWYNAIFPVGTEVCQNFICLAPDAHAYWAREYFVLKPIRISDDKKRLDVQFFWLPQRSYSPKVNILKVPQLSVDLDQGPNLTMLHNNESLQKICSGDEISLETDDPVSKPLPDFDLLEMQWFLHRVAAISAAAEPQDDFCEDSDGYLVIASEDQWDVDTDDDWDIETSR